MKTMTTPNNVRLAAAIASLLLVATLIIRTTEAAFTATTDNPDNTWSSGTVVLTDDDGGTDAYTGTAMFDASIDAAMKPGVPVSRCITVSYNGTLDPSAVKLNVAASTAGTLDAYLSVKVHEGTSTTGLADCSGFTADAAIYDGTLSGMTGSYGTWDPAGAASKTYRFTVEVADDNAAQGTTAGATTFRWSTTS